MAYGISISYMLFAIRDIVPLFPHHLKGELGCQFFGLLFGLSCPLPDFIFTDKYADGEYFGVGWSFIVKYFIDR